MNFKKFVSAAIFLSGAFAFAQESGFSAADSIASKMVSVEGGTFKMGSLENEKNESPVHDVKVNSFLMCATEVTQEEYEAVMGCNYSANKGKTLPVEEVSWYDAVIFCNKLSEMSGFEPVYSLGGSKNTDEWGEIPRMDASEEVKAIWSSVEADINADGYRLPTEAEWEYAAKGGNTPENSVYSGSPVITVCAWSKVNSADGITKEVGLKRANVLGLFDMSGNVWEWCYDWYGNYRYAANDNPLGESDSTVTGRKIRRGGSVKSDAVFCRNENRASSVPVLRGVDLGFRVVRSAPAAAAPEAETSDSVVSDTDDVSDGIIEDVFVDDGFAK